MRDDIPVTHAQDAQALENAGFESLVAIHFTAPAAAGLVLRFSAHKQVVWQGLTFEAIPFSLTGLGSNSSGEAIRPKLAIPNAAGAFSPYAHQGWLNNAIVVRQLVRTADVLGNVANSSQKKWRVSKVVSLTKHMIVMELRGVFDGHQFKIPPRAYYPPDFPSVSLF